MSKVKKKWAAFDKRLKELEKKAEETGSISHAEFLTLQMLEPTLTDYILENIKKDKAPSVEQ